MPLRFSLFCSLIFTAIPHILKCICLLDDNAIPAYYFGDQLTQFHTALFLILTSPHYLCTPITSRDLGVIPFIQNRSCSGYEEVLQFYRQIAPTIHMSSPRSFVPIIREGIRITQQSKKVSVLCLRSELCHPFPLHNSVQHTRNHN